MRGRLALLEMAALMTLLVLLSLAFPSEATTATHAPVDAVDAADLVVHEESEEKTARRKGGLTLEAEFEDLDRLMITTPSGLAAATEKSLGALETHISGSGIKAEPESQPDVEAPVEKVNITGVSRPRLLRRLWEATVPGVYDIVTQSKKHLEYDSSDKPDFTKPILRYQGRMIGVDFRENLVDPTLYDRSAGAGRLATVAGLIRERKDALSLPFDEEFSRAVRLIERWHHVEMTALYNRCVLDFAEGVTDDVTQCVLRTVNATAENALTNKFKTGDAAFDKLFEKNMKQVMVATFALCMTENEKCTEAAKMYRKHELMFNQRQIELQTEASNRVRTTTTGPKRPSGQ